MTKSALGTVILFARVPRLGHGKQRLAASIGAVRTNQIYKIILRKTLRTVSLQLGWKTLLVLDPVSACSKPGSIFSSNGVNRLPRLDQRGKDLGRRMAAALRRAPPGPRVLIGADIVGLDPGSLRRALIACRRSEFVFGPVEDGGFWLVGCKRPPSLRCFDDIRWSRETTLKETVGKMPNAWRIAYADRLRDIDEVKDLLNSDFCPWIK